MNRLNYFILSFGIALSGYFIGHGMVQFKTLDRDLDMRGLSEKIVDSNEAKLNLQFNVAHDSMLDLNAKIAEFVKLTTGHLFKAGFTKEEIQKGPINMTDKIAQEYGGAVKGPRYVARFTISISSKKVNLITDTAQNTDEILKLGVPLTGSSVKYYFTNLNEIKPIMLEEATKNAWTAAFAFAKSTGAEVGKIKSASQGLFSINALNDEYDADASFKKKVRVVSAVTFYLN